MLFKNGKFDFELAADPRKYVSNNADYPYLSLSDIKIAAYNFASKTCEVQKTIKFYQSYFGSDSTGNQRTRLDSLQILDKTGLVIQHIITTPTAI